MKYIVKIVFVLILISTIIGCSGDDSGSTSTTTVPEAPAIGVASIGDSSATITFTAPASNGGSAITSYTVTSSPGGLTATGTSSPITITGLTNGTSYTFTVTATNGVGVSTASTASNSIIPTPTVTVSGAPIIGVATAGDSSATITFTAPASNGGSAITSYTVTSSPGGLTATGTSSPITITGLINGTVYTFTVTATNGVGVSTASASSNSVTPTITIQQGEVYNPITGKTWMDRNLGASRVATSSTDAAAYGDLYQWGRAADGHEKRTSSTTTILSTSDTPAHGSFIVATSGNYDWRSPQNDNLWQGVNGINNPCPTGYRVPTLAELEAERLSWTSNDAAGAFASPLKLPVAGSRMSNGSLYGDGSYWSSTVYGAYSHDLYFDSGSALTSSGSRASGGSVRCLKD